MSKIFLSKSSFYCQNEDIDCKNGIIGVQFLSRDEIFVGFF